MLGDVYKRQAQYAYYSYFDNQRLIEKNSSQAVKDNVYLGPSYESQEIKSFLDSQNIQYTYLESKNLLETTAKLISEKNVVGWFQGKMEWGPRALGNRSILADPRQADMKDILNAKIKHRESFRPFAPSIMEEYLHENFELDIPSPYMLLVAKIKKPQSIPAVTHLDGTGRVQTVSKESNSLYYDLIQNFYKLTGVPVIINTSMNVRGEPVSYTHLTLPTKA